MHNTEERSAEFCAASSLHTSSSNPSCWGHFLGSPVVQRISYKMQLLCPVTEWLQLPQTQRISSVWPCKEAAWLPLSSSCPADAPCLEETGSWSTVNCQLWAGIQSPLLSGLSTESPCMENGQRVTPVKPETTQELQKGLQFKAGVCLMP